MNIVVTCLGVVTGEDNGAVKFLLLEDKVLLFGKCLWHKDLVVAFFGKEVDVTVVAAGILPKNVSKVSLDEEYWGEWKSNGYDVITPHEYRSVIQRTLESFEAEINRLWENKG